MSSTWLPIAIGLALGLIPPRLFYSSNWRHAPLLEATTGGHLRSTDGSRSGYRSTKWWKLPLMWIDPVRGYFSAHLIAIGLYHMPMDTTEQIAIILGISGACTFAIFAVQMEFGRQRSKDLLAPCFFLFGFIAGISYGRELMGGAVAIISVLAFIGTKNFKFGFILSGIVACIFGYPFLGLGANLAIFTLTALCPVPYAFLRNARLVIPVSR